MEPLGYQPGSSATTTTTRASQQTATARAEYVWLGNGNSHASDELDLDALFDELSQEDGFIDGFKQATREIGQAFHKDQDSLAAVRMAAGLSQKMLADMIGSTQPYIARVESGGVNNPGIELVDAIAKATNCDLNLVASFFIKDKP